MQETKLCVKDMCCAEEVQTIERAVRHLNGVQEVRPNLLNRTVLVIHDQSLTSKEELIRVVNQVGMKASTGEADEQSSLSRRWHFWLTILSGIGVAAGLVMHWANAWEILERTTFLLAVISGGWFIAPKAWSAPLSLV
jgi:Cd2+/Zn2+-exporting ATPase